MLEGTREWLANFINPQEVSYDQQRQMSAELFNESIDGSFTGVPETQSNASFSREWGGRWEDTQFWRHIYGGESEPDDFGMLRDFNHRHSIDYYQLRTLSRQLFTENMYAAAVIGRVVTNVINTGLNLEADPAKFITGLEGEAYVDWTSEVEEMYKLWAADKSVDVQRKHDLSTLERVAYTEALVEGDVLKVVKFDRKTGLPKVRLIPGRHVRTGFNSLENVEDGNRILNGVEVNAAGEHVAYHVVEDGDFGHALTTKRILAKGRTSNRDTATLIYNAPPPAGKTRGFPLLYRIITPLKQIGRYSRYELKAAEINAALAMWVEKGEDVAGSNPLGGPTLKSSSTEVSVGDDTSKVVDLPPQRVQGGTIINELAWGEKPHSFDTKRPNVNFGTFKKAVLQDIAAALEIPPEVLMLMFENSFSASRQATLEFKAFVTREREYFAKQFSADVYGQWLMGMALNEKIKAPGYVKAIKAGDIFGINGWRRARFTGFIKQNVDILKEARAYQEYIQEGLITRDQASKDLTGGDFMTNVKRLADENKLLAAARAELLGEINTSRSIVDEKGEGQNGQQQEMNLAMVRTAAAVMNCGFDQRATENILKAIADPKQIQFRSWVSEVLNVDDTESVDKDIDAMDTDELEEAKND